MMFGFTLSRVDVTLASIMDKPMCRWALAKYLVLLDVDMKTSLWTAFAPLKPPLRGPHAAAVSIVGSD
jgi:hypothetical protein